MAHRAERLGPGAERVGAEGKAHGAEFSEVGSRNYLKSEVGIT